VLPPGPGRRPHGGGGRHRGPVGRAGCTAGRGDPRRGLARVGEPRHTTHDRDRLTRTTGDRPTRTTGDRPTLNDDWTRAHCSTTTIRCPEPVAGARARTSPPTPTG